MLNPAQEEAVTTTEGPLCILAGPGTGKTHTLVARIRHLIENEKAHPHEILALTFTNKAAHELKERLNKVTQAHSQAVHAYTFHALAARLLRKFWREDFTITEKLASKDVETHPNTPPILDFDGLLQKAIEIPFSVAYRYIVVDEYQDLTELQIEFLQKLSQNTKNVCIVGDPDQSIYGWREVNSRNMEEFQKRYPETKTVILTENYRNPPAVLKAATALIQNNVNRLEKTIFPIKNDPLRIKLWEAQNEEEEKDILIHLLEKQIGSISFMHSADTLDLDHKNRGFSDISILYRTQERGKKLATMLMQKGYPVERSAPENFWESPEIQDVLEELELLKNLTDWPELPFSDWLRSRLKTHAERTGLNDFKKQRLWSLLSLAYHFNGSPLHEALQQFLDESKLEQDVDNLPMKDKRPMAENIQLLTLHAAKGLEFPVVVLVGLNEGELPHKKYLEDPAGLEEERRLLYVGLTRASEELHLVHCRKDPPSRFLAELPKTCLELGTLPQKRLNALKKKMIKKAQMKLL